MKSKKLDLKWIILLFGFVLLMAACGSETPVAEQPLPEQPEATAPPAEEVPTAEPEVPTAEPEVPLETEPEAEVPEISQPIARWNSVSERGNWLLLGYGDTLNPTVVEPDTYVFINFSNVDDQVNGSGGCNNFFSSYTADDDFNLTINGPVGSTMMACEKGMEQETMFLGALETVMGYNLTEEGYLLLDYDSGVGYAEQMTFIPETALEDTLWVLMAYGDPNNLTPNEPGVVTTAIFSTEGTLSGNAGCNNYTAEYQIEDGQLSISMPAINLMACDTGMEQESAYAQLLEKAQSYRLGYKTLEIETSDGSVLRFSAQHLPLENVRWLLASINGEAVPEDLNVNVLFTPAKSPAAQSEENAVNGSAGCNTFFGSYTITGDAFSTG
ncbi:MAG: META domain-containing protein, partial [Anaerolineales bacterium]